MPNNPAQQNTSASEQEWQTRLNSMDAAFNQASEYITQATSQINGFKTTVTKGGSVTWAQMEQVAQLLSQAQSQIHQARQSLPIGVSGRS